MPLNADNHPLVNLAPAEAAMLKRTRELVAEEIGPNANRMGQSDAFAWETFHTLAREGLIATAIPRDYGGHESSMLLRVRLMEELGRCSGPAAAVLAGSDGSARAIVVGAREEVKREVLPRLADGSRQVCLAITEPQAGSDMGSISTKIMQDHGGVTISGKKRHITRANVADYIVVAGRSGERNAGTSGLQCFLVDRESEGVTVSADMPKMGWWGLPFAEIRLNKVRVSEERRLGNPDQGMAMAQDALLRARIGHASIALGRMSGALQIAAQYVNKRQVRGKSLGSMQGIQWMLADMGARIESERCMIYTTALRYDRGDADVGLHASMAKMRATDLSMRVTVECLQLLGANGYLKSYPLERFMRDAKFNQIGEGTSEIHKNVIGAHLVKAASRMAPHPCVPADPEAFEYLEQSA